MIIPWVSVIVLIIIFLILIAIKIINKSSNEIAKLTGKIFILIVILIPLVVFSIISLLEMFNVEIPWDKLSFYASIISLGIASLLAIFIYFINEDKEEKRQERSRPKLNMHFEIRGNDLKKEAYVFINNTGEVTLKNVELRVTAFMVRTGGSFTIQDHFFDVGDINPERKRIEQIFLFIENKPHFLGQKDNHEGNLELEAPFRINIKVDAENMRPNRKSYNIDKTLNFELESDIIDSK